MTRANLTQGQAEWLTHMQRWGSDGYPIRKRGSRWFFYEAFGVGGTQAIAYKTKAEAVAACEAYKETLLDYVAGRLGNPLLMFCEHCGAEPGDACGFDCSSRYDS